MYRSPGNKQRKVFIVSKGRRLYCPRGHHIPEDFITPGILEHGGVRCSGRTNHHAGEKPTECRAFLWVLIMPGGWRLVAEVTEQELREAGERHMSLEQMLEFLGIEGPMLSLGTRNSVEQTLAADRARRQA